MKNKNNKIMEEQTEKEKNSKKEKKSKKNEIKEEEIFSDKPEELTEEYIYERAEKIIKALLSDKT